MPAYRNELERFIYEKCYDDIFDSLADYVSAYPNSLNISYARVEYPDTATLSDMILEFTNNVRVVGDTIYFDAVVSCDIEAEEELYHDVRSDSVSQWFRVSCIAVVEDRIKKFSVCDIEVYEKSGGHWGGFLICGSATSNG